MSHLKHEIWGIDISQAQGGSSKPLRLARAKNKGMDLAYIRLTTGDKLDRDAMFFVEEACMVGMPWGGYHALQPGVGRQAQVFYNAIMMAQERFGEMDLPPVCDVEKAGLTEDKVRGHLEAFRGRWDVKPMIYTSRTLWHRLIGTDADWAIDYYLWVAHHNARWHPWVPYPWRKMKRPYELWQMAVSQTPFHHGPVDLNVFWGDRLNFDSFMYEWRQGIT